MIHRYWCGFASESLRILIEDTDENKKNNKNLDKTKNRPASESAIFFFATPNSSSVSATKRINFIVYTYGILVANFYNN
jgi:hypothetical protein